jgi:AbrB family looped-hinge helix DNA binding protein
MVKAVCGDCKGLIWAGGTRYQCGFKDSEVLDPKVVEERVEIECDKFKEAERELRVRMQQYREVGITTVYGNGSVQLPKEVREALEIKDGDKILWIKKGEREFTFRKVGMTYPFKPHYL